MLFKHNKPHVAQEWIDVICPEPFNDQWKAYNNDTANIGKENRKIKNRGLRHKRVKQI